MELQKHEEMMEKVKAKLNADKEDVERREKAMHALEVGVRSLLLLVGKEKMAVVKAEEERGRAGFRV